MRLRNSASDVHQSRNATAKSVATAVDRRGVKLEIGVQHGPRYASSIPLSLVFIPNLSAESAAAFFDRRTNNTLLLSISLSPVSQTDAELQGLLAKGTDGTFHCS